MMKMKVYLINLLIITCSWISAGYTYYVLQFYVKKIPGNFYVNTIFSSISECVACIASGIIATKIGEKHTIQGSFLLAFIFGALLAFFNDSGVVVIAVFVIFAKAGSTSAFNMCFIATSSFFPVVYNSSVFGFTNLISKSILTTAPIVSELPEPTPMVFFCGFCVLSFITILFLREPPAGSIAGSRRMSKMDQSSDLKINDA
jgi:hypothetical protein